MSEEAPPAPQKKEETAKKPLLIQMEAGLMANTSVDAPSPLDSSVNFKDSNSTQPRQILTALGLNVVPPSWHLGLWDVAIALRWRRDRQERTKEETLQSFTQKTTADQMALGVGLMVAPLITEKLGGGWTSLRFGNDFSLKLVGVNGAAFAHLTRIETTVERSSGGTDRGQGWSEGILGLSGELTLGLVYLEMGSWELFAGNRQSYTLNGAMHHDGPPLKGDFNAARFGEWVVGLAKEF